MYDSSELARTRTYRRPVPLCQEVSEPVVKRRTHVVSSLSLAVPLIAVFCYDEKRRERRNENHETKKKGMLW